MVHLRLSLYHSTVAPAKMVCQPQAGRCLIQEMGLQVRIKHRRFQTTDNEHCFPRYPNLVQGLEIVRADHVWVSDITYIRLRCDFVNLAVIIDVYTRCIRGWYLGRRLDQSLTLLALQRALTIHVPVIHKLRTEEVNAWP